MAAIRLISQTEPPPLKADTHMSAATSIYGFHSIGIASKFILNGGLVFDIHGVMKENV